MLSICPGVFRIYTPHRSFHLHYPCISMYPQSLINDILGGCDGASLEMHWEAMIEWVWKCTWRSRWSELRDTLGNRDQSSLEMHCKAVIKQVWRFTWRPRSSKLTRCTCRPWSIGFGDALGGHDRACLVMQLETEIEWTQRCTWMPWSSEFGGVLWGGRFGGRRDGVKARTPALDYVGLCMVIVWIWLQTWTRVLIGVDVW